MKELGAFVLVVAFILFALYSCMSDGPVGDCPATWRGASGCR